MEEKRKPGRPKRVGGRDVKTYLDEETIQDGTEIGKGSLSEGIRTAVKFYKKNGPQKQV